MENPITVFGRPLTTRLPLLTITNVVQVGAAAVEVPITQVSTNRFGYLLSIEAVLTATIPTTAVQWDLLDANAGTRLVTLSLNDATAAAGTVRSWCFPHPWKTGAQSEQFVLQPSVATGGVWDVIVNGFYSST